MSSSASGDELRLVIEGKLRDSRHDPQNVQVVLKEADTGFNIDLQDAEGVFLRVEPIAVDLSEPGGSSDGCTDGDDDNDDAKDVDELRDALLEAKEQQATKDLEIAKLREQLEKEKNEVQKCVESQLCAVSRVDSAISAKDKEIQLELPHSGTPSPRESPSEHPSNSESGETLLPVKVKSSNLRRGRAPPVEMFSGEDSDNTLDNCFSGMRPKMKVRVSDFVCRLEKTCLWKRLHAWGTGISSGHLVDK